MKEKEQVIEKTGWHCWCDGDGIQRVDRCILLGDAWWYHVIEDTDGEHLDEWQMDCAMVGPDPRIFFDKESALLEQERLDEKWKKSAMGRQKEMDAELAPLVEQVKGLGYDYLSRLVEIAFGPRFRVSFDHEVDERERQDMVLNMIKNGGTYHIVAGKSTTFIPIGSIDHVEKRNGGTQVVSKSGKVFLYEGEEKYRVLVTALKIYNNH